MPSSDSKTGYKGVYQHRSSGRFGAQRSVDGRTVSLGTFDTAVEAALPARCRSLPCCRAPCFCPSRLCSPSPSAQVSPSYCSPELSRAVLGKQADRMRAACTLDMWSFGLVFFELFARQPYFADKPDTMQQLASYAELEVPKDIVDDIQARHVLKKLLVKNHVERANIQAVLKHAYLCGGMDTIQKASSFGYLQQTQAQLQTMLTDLSSHVKAG